MLKGLIGAVIGGLVGAAIWAVIGFSTGYEVGFVAWGVGVLAGVGMRVGSGESDGFLPGVAAALIALGSIAAGKFAVVHFAVGNELDKIRESISQATLEEGKLYMANQLVDEYAQAGKTLKWPEGMTRDDADAPEDYPADLWQDVEARWVTMTPEHQEEYRQALIEETLAVADEFHTFADGEVFRESLNFYDVVWGLLALASAFRIGSGSEGD
jgi:hypothetical protein